ncbi:30S ribosomal protein S6e [Candidatus Bathyarchaeota archaeon]|nr:MAG: 30S ribosomal protein S6e [Candidatus Bathyarchaeota archaeon]
MAKFKIVLSDPETGKSQKIELEEARAVPLIGRKIGEIIDGTILGLSGYKIQITGGTDKDGFPMRPDIHGGVRRRVIVSSGPGFKPKRKGERRRKMLRGNVITEEIVQINMKIVEKPKTKAKEEKAEEKKKEIGEKKEEAPTEEKEEKSEGEKTE